MTGARRLRIADEQRTEGWVTARYNQLADSWSRRIRRLGFVRAYRSVFRRVARRIDAPVTKIADFGIGAGDASMALIRALPARPSSVIGIDASEEMLRVASAGLRQMQLDVTTLCCDMCTTRVPTHSVDVVIAAHSVEHLEDPGAALAEMNRVLVPGGTMVLIMTRCTLPTITLEASWPIHCVRSDLLQQDLAGRHYEEIAILRFPFAFVPNLLSFVCVARKPMLAS